MGIAILLRYMFHSLNGYYNINKIWKNFCSGDGNFKKMYEGVYRLQEINMLKENTNAHSKGSTAWMVMDYKSNFTWKVLMSAECKVKKIIEKIDINDLPVFSLSLLQSIRYSCLLPKI